jgi:hypothetical protein
MSLNTPSNPFIDGPYVLPISPGPTVFPVQMVDPGNPSVLIWELTPVGASTVNSHTLQNLIEVSYIRTANEVLYQGFNNLDNAITTSTNTLNTLQQIQTLHNAVYTRSLSAFPFHYDSAYGSRDDYMKEYNRLASAYYGQPIIPDFIFKSAGAQGMDGTGRLLYSSFSKFSSDMKVARMQLSDNVHMLSGQLSPADLANPNSLYATAKKVLDEMPPLTGPSSGPNYVDTKLWILDGYSISSGQDLAQTTPQLVSGTTGRITPGGTVINPLNESGVLVNPLGSGYLGSQASRNNAAIAGNIQQSITFAITAAQSLNDTQKEKVRQFLFVFEEYYKSAATILATITRIIEKMAQGVRPS